MTNKSTLIQLIREWFYLKQDNSGADSNSEVPEVLHEWMLRQRDNMNEQLHEAVLFFFRIVAQLAKKYSTVYDLRQCVRTRAV
jgi:hypothetical protein